MRPNFGYFSFFGGQNGSKFWLFEFLKLKISGFQCFKGQIWNI